MNITYSYCIIPHCNNSSIKPLDVRHSGEPNVRTTFKSQPTNNHNRPNHLIQGVAYDESPPDWYRHTPQPILRPPEITLRLCSYLKNRTVCHQWMIVVVVVYILPHLHHVTVNLVHLVIHLLLTGVFCECPSLHVWKGVVITLFQLSLLFLVVVVVIWFVSGTKLVSIFFLTCAVWL